MRPDELRAWRRSLGLTQEAAAKIFGVSRVTEQSWEGGRNPPPHWVDYLCRDEQRQARKRDRSLGPVFLIYHLRPLASPVTGALEAGTVTTVTERFKDSATALRFVRQKWGKGAFFDPMILDQYNDVIWHGDELAEEMSKIPAQPARTPEEIEALRQAIKEIQDHIASLPVGDPNFTDKDLYDEDGLFK